MKKIIQVIKPAIVTALFFVAVNASAVPILTGDFNRNGIVDPHDFSVFKMALGTTFTALEPTVTALGVTVGTGPVTVSPIEEMDFNRNGIVDPIDFLIFKTAFGTTVGTSVDPPGGNGVSLSEPATIVMFALGLAFAIGFRTPAQKFNECVASTV
jgi:hypothetical protein